MDSVYSRSVLGSKTQLTNVKNDENDECTE
jgi:hypothetical protein